LNEPILGWKHLALLGVTISSAHCILSNLGQKKKQDKIRLLKDDDPPDEPEEGPREDEAGGEDK